MTSQPAGPLSNWVKMWLVVKPRMKDGTWAPQQLFQQPLAGPQNTSQQIRTNLSFRLLFTDKLFSKRPRLIPNFQQADWGTAIFKRKRTALWRTWIFSVQTLSFSKDVNNEPNVIEPQSASNQASSATRDAQGRCAVWALTNWPRLTIPFSGAYFSVDMLRIYS